MLDTWHIVKWVCVAITFAYLIVQVLAIRRLRGVQKKRGIRIGTVMLFVISGSDLIRSVFFFENRTAGRVGMLVIAVAAFVATFVLARMLESPTDPLDNQPGTEQEQYVQPLKLS